ncbi:LolA family protein [Streptomyces sp. URMC 129]|uniref:LolA family protein n=1 Tax=Streptomyces sp. URMC 129 TaxID=3423407 RepID=UPI003F1A8909
MALNNTVRRAAVPVAVVAGIAAVGAGLWPAIASDGGPDLPDVTAEELLARVAESETAQLSGTVQVDADLGIPDLGGMLSGVLSGMEGPAGRLAELAAGESTLRVAVDGPEHQRLAVVSGSEEFALIHNGDELWAYDSSSNTVLSAEVPEGVEAEERDAAEWLGGLTPRQAAERFLQAAGEHADISVAGTARVADRGAYQLLVEPTGEAAAESGVESVRISIDAETGVPLALTAEADGGRSLDVAFSQIDYAKPAGGVFDFTPPSDAEVLEVNPEEPLGILPDLLPDALGR